MSELLQLHLDTVGLQLVYLPWHHRRLERDERYERPSAKNSHIEETAAGIKGDDQDRKALRDKLELCIDPLDPEQHPDGLMNIVTGQVVSHSSVNVDKAQLLGNTQMESFECSWPGEFHDSIQHL